MWKCLARCSLGEQWTFNCCTNIILYRTPYNVINTRFVVVFLLCAVVLSVLNGCFLQLLLPLLLLCVTTLHAATTRCSTSLAHSLIDWLIDWLIMINLWSNTELCLCVNCLWPIELWTMSVCLSLRGSHQTSFIISLVGHVTSHRLSTQLSISTN